MLEHYLSKLDFLIVAVVAVAAFIGLIYFRNWSIGVTFSKDILPIIKNDPEALSAYFRAYNWMLVVLIVGATFAGVLN